MSWLITYAERALEQIVSNTSYKVAEPYIIRMGSGPLGNNTGAAFFLVKGASNMRRIKSILVNSLGMVGGISLPDTGNIAIGVFYCFVPPHSRPSPYRQEEIWMVGTIAGLSTADLDLMDEAPFQSNTDFTAPDNSSYLEEIIKTLPDCDVSLFRTINSAKNSDETSTDDLSDLDLLVHGISNIKDANNIAIKLAESLQGLNLIYLCTPLSCSAYLPTKIRGNYGVIAANMRVNF